MALKLAVLARDLSFVMPSPATETAACRVLEMPDPSAVLGRIYHFLVWQRTLRTALGHLEAAGADLSAIEIPIETFRRTFPSATRTVWDLDREPPVTAADLVEIFTTHRRRLAAPIDVLVDAGVDRFTLVSGRAYEARYPSYAHRVEFDTDLVTPDMTGALDVVDALDRGGYPLESIRIHRMGSAPHATFEIRRREGGHLVSIGVLVGGYHAHRGPLWDRAGVVTLRDRPVRAARPEDLLVMLAARAESKHTFALVNFNDAAVILDTDGAGLDWDLVTQTARISGLEATLAVVLRRAEGVLGRAEVPGDVWKRLRGRTGLRRRVTERAASAAVSLGGVGRGSVDDLAGRAWTLATGVRQQRRPDTQSLVARARVGAERRILARQIRAARSGRPLSARHRFATARRTRCGALCEVSPRLAAGERCISLHAGWRGSPEARARLEDVAARVPPPAGTHDCNHLRFDLWRRDGW